MFGLPTELKRAYSKLEKAVLEDLDYITDRLHNNLQRRLRRQHNKGMIPSETNAALAELATIKGRSKSPTIAIAREKIRRLERLENEYGAKLEVAKAVKKAEMNKARAELKAAATDVRAALMKRRREGVLEAEATKGLEEIRKITELVVKDEDDYKEKIKRLESLKDKTPIDEESVLEELHKRNPKIYELYDKSKAITDKQVATFWDEYNKLKQVIGSDPDFFRYKELSEAIFEVMGEEDIEDGSYEDFDAIVSAIKEEYNKQVKLLTESPDEEDDSWWLDNPLKW